MEFIKKLLKKLSSIGSGNKTRTIAFIGSFVLVGAAMTFYTIANTRSPRLAEMESMQYGQNIETVASNEASGGQFTQITQSYEPSPGGVSDGGAGTGTTQSAFMPTAPYYSTFYYAWYGSDDDRYSYWHDNGHSPYSNWFSNYLPDMDPNSFDPENELYRTKDDSTIYWQLNKMKEAKIEVAISSWWGQNRKEDDAFNKIITDVMNRADNPYPNLRWATYFEQEGFSNPSVESIVDDINYIKDKYASQYSYLKIGGKPVVFVYAGNDDGPEMAERWRQVREQTGVYTVLKVYGGYEGDASKANSWHQYAPANRAGQHGNYSYYVSPGFWKDGDPVRLERNLQEFRNAVSDMVDADTTWKLIQTWNEWGEGSSVEPGEQVVQTTSGDAAPDPYGAIFGNAYIDALNEILPTLETPEGTVAGASTGPLVSISNSTDGNNGDVLSATTEGSFTFATIGDVGADQPDTISTLSTIPQIGSSFTLAVGDMSYNDITPESAWCDFVQSKVGANHPFQIVMGNHEDDDRVDGFIGEFRKCLPDRLNSVGEYAAEYYFDYPSASPLARVIMIGAGNDFQGEKYDYPKGSTHYQWLESAIDSARASNIKWIIVGMHKVCISVGNKDCEIEQDLVDLLTEKRVDLVLSGHEHDYQRTKQLSCIIPGQFNSSCVANANSTGYTKGNGLVWVVQGMAGGGGFTSVNPTDSEAGYFAKAMGNGAAYDFIAGTSTNSVGKGLMKYVVTPDSLTGELIVSYRTGGSGTYFADTFSITSDGSEPPAPPSDTTAPTIAISQPADGSELGGTVTVAADATDDTQVNKVEFLVDGVVRWTDTTAPYEFNLITSAYSDGPHSIAAKAYDSASNVGQSSLVHVTFKNQTSSCTTSAPSYAQYTTVLNLANATSYKVWTRYASSSPATVYLTVDGGCPMELSLDSASGWSWLSWQGSLDFASGSHTIELSTESVGLMLDSLIFSDDLGCVPTGFGENCLTVVDSTNPEVSIVAPETDGTVIDGTAILVASASDDVGVEYVEWFINGTSVGQATISPEGYTIEIDTIQYDDGEYAFTAKAFDAAGNNATSEVRNLIIENIPTPPIGTGSTLTYIVDADATVREDKENRNYARDTNLEVDGSPAKAAYLKFKPSDINGRTVVSAKLFLYNTNSSSEGGVVRTVEDDNWDENRIKWNNAPIAGGIIGTIREVSPGNWYSVDLTSTVTQDGVYSFRIDSSYDNGADYGSKESENRPKLVIVVQ